MPKAKAKRSLADDLTAEDIREAFARAGSERKLKPNAALVQQGKACSSVFLVLEGALRAGSDRPIGVGAFVGEVSFLLGGAPTLGVTATAASVVAEVKHDALQRICVEDPALAGAIFKALAATLAERVHDESIAARASLVHGSEPASDVAPEALERSSAELRDDFGLPPSAGALLAHAAGVAALERESVAEDGTSATAFLFASHLCVEQLAFGFTTRVAIKLSDVLAVLKGNRPDSPLRKKPKQAPRKGPVAAVAGSGSSDTEIIVQARNCSVTLDLAAGCEAFARALEASRLAARAMPPPPAAAAASKPPPLKRRASSIAWVSGAAAAGKADTPNLMPELARALEPPKKKAPKAAAGARLGALSPAQWAAVMAGAERRRWRDGELVLEEGAEGRALYQLVKGSLKVALHSGARSAIVGRLAAGATFGERSLLAGGGAGASLIAEGDVVVVKLPAAHLAALCASDAALPSALYGLLATLLARRLRAIVVDDAPHVPALALPPGAAAPPMSVLCASDATLAIVHRFVERERPGDLPLVDVVLGVRALHGEADADELRAAAAALGTKYVEKAGALPGVPPAARAACAKELKTLLAPKAKAPPPRLRRAFDALSTACVAALEARCGAAFVGSAHYDYVLQLKAREMAPPAMCGFQALRVLGEGGFGQVLEVVKRDCGKRFAMKVQRKAGLIASLADPEANATGAPWQEVALLEKTLQASLFHPLLVNLCYAFQNDEFLVMVMDACFGGDLGQFVLGECSPLTQEQVRFVGMETAAVLAFLHSRHVLYRDLKPENLLLDGDGHVRLIDFGLALQGEKAMPSSLEIAGTTFYMAPEVYHADAKGAKPYGAAADWWTLGILLYELSEHELPFGDEPPETRAEWSGAWRAPKKPMGKEMRSLVDGLLEFSAAKRLQGDGVMGHALWEGEEWELVGQRRLASPLKAKLKEREGRPVDDEKAARGAQRALKTAASVARHDKKRAAAVDTKSRVGRASASVGTARAPKKAAAAAKKAAAKEMEVAGWEFVAPQAIEQEFLECMGSTVSLL